MWIPRRASLDRAPTRAQALNRVLRPRLGIVAIRSGRVRCGDPQIPFHTGCVCSGDRGSERPACCGVGPLARSGGSSAEGPGVPRGVGLARSRRLSASSAARVSRRGSDPCDPSSARSRWMRRIATDDSTHARTVGRMSGAIYGRTAARPALLDAQSFRRVSKRSIARSCST